MRMIYLQARNKINLTLNYTVRHIVFITNYCDTFKTEVQAVYSKQLNII